MYEPGIDLSHLSPRELALHIEAARERQNARGALINEFGPLLAPRMSGWPK